MSTDPTVIVAGARTPMGRMSGSLKGFSGSDLGGFAIKGANNAEILIMPGETQTLKWKATTAGVIPYYCTDFCSALHQEMSGYVRVSPAGSKTPIKFGTGVTEENTAGGN